MKIKEWLINSLTEDQIKYDSQMRITSSHDGETLTSLSQCDEFKNSKLSFHIDLLNSAKIFKSEQIERFAEDVKVFAVGISLENKDGYIIRCTEDSVILNKK